MLKNIYETLCEFRKQLEANALGLYKSKKYCILDPIADTFR